MRKAKIIKALALTLFMATTILLAAQTNATSVDIQRETLTKLREQTIENYGKISSLLETNDFPRRNLTIVDWDRHTESYSDSWSYKSLEWLFGPRLKLTIYKYPGMMEIKSKSSINFNEYILFELTIPKSIVEKGEDLALARVVLTNNKWNESGFLEYEANIELTYDFNESQFYILNTFYNATSGAYLTNVTLFYLDAASSNVVESSETITINFVGYFETSAVKGIYRVHYDVFDTNYNNYADQDQYVNPMELALGGDYMDFFREMYGDFYTIHLMGESGEKLYTISTNQTFSVELNITTSNILNATILIEMPPRVPRRTLVVDHYTEMKTFKGGWVYNKTTGEYVWDPNVTILLPIDKFGPHMGFIEMWRDLLVNTTYYDWDNKTYYNTTINVIPYLAIIFDNQTKTFVTKIYIEYDKDVPGEIGPERIKIIRFFDPGELEGDYWDVFELNTTASTYFAANGTYHIKVVGYFNDKIGEGSAEIKARVIRSDGKEIQRYIREDEPYYMRVMINKPYLEVTSPKGYHSRFIVKKNETLQLLVRYTGSQDDMETTDGVRLHFDTWNNWMTENVSYSSHLEAIIIIDVKRNTTKFMAWNTTTKYVYEYGDYWDYDEYGNAILKTGYHWEPYYYNQTSGEWKRGYIGYRDPAAVVEPPFKYVNYTVVNDGVFVNVYLNITFKEDVSDTYFYAAASLVERYYGEDMNQPWGAYVVKDWFMEEMYSFTTPDGVKHYVDFRIGNLAFLSTGGIYEIVEKPYIVINGTKLYLKYSKKYDPYSDYTYYRILQSKWDPIRGKTIYYYITEDGIEIPVTIGRTIKIFNITLELSTGENMTILATSDYPSDIYFENLNETFEIYFLVNGSYILLKDGNYTIREIKFIAEIEASPAGYYTVVYNTSELLRLTNDILFGPNGTYYIKLTNGTTITVKYDDDIYLYYYEKNGTRYYLSYIQRLYNGTYNGHEVIVDDYRAGSIYYALINGSRFYLPYPGAKPCCLEELNQPVPYGLVPVDRFVNINGTLYLIKYNQTLNGTIHYITINTIFGPTNVSITEVNNTAYVIIENNITWIGDGYYWKAPYGLINETNGLFSVVDYLKMSPNNCLASEFWYPDPMILLNGSYLNTTFALVIWIYKWNISGEIVYSYNNYIQVDYNDDGSATRYIYLLNGSKYIIKKQGTPPQLIGYNVTLAIKNESTFEFTFMNATYNVTQEFLDYKSATYRTYKGFYDNGTFYLINYARSWRRVFTINWNGTNYTVEGITEPVYEEKVIYGYPRGWLYRTYADTWENFEVIIGSPRIDMWGVRIWRVNPDNGALDLDGDLTTKNDQFYVKRVYMGDYYWSVNSTSLNVHIYWDPNTTKGGNELNLYAWMGISTHTWRYRWNVTFYWFYAENMSIVTPSDMEKIRNTVLDNSTGKPKPGYWGIAWMLQNKSWEDILREARENGWDWVSEEQKWTWLWFGFSEEYYSSVYTENYSQLMRIALRYEFAGLFIYNDSNDNGIMDISACDGSVNVEESEATHYYIFDSVENVSILTPGEAFGITNDTGHLELRGDAWIDFGITYRGINGTTIPFNGRSIWWWYGGSELVGQDFNDFDSRPVKTRIDLLAFTMHFKGNLTSINDTYTASIKIDQYVGNWNPNIVGGRRVLENRSLSINYYVYAETDMSWYVSTGDRTITNNDVAEASTIRLGAGSSTFAEIVMGGTYLWSKNITKPYNVSSFTVPLGTFESIYVDYGSNNSAAGWSFKQDMYFLSIGFKNWDGYGVYQDPEVISNVGGKNTSTTPMGDTNPPVIELTGLEQPPEYDESPTITAKVTDENEIKRVVLYYTVDGYTYSIDMNPIGDNQYSASIPAYPYGTTVEYYIIAEDAYGNLAESTHYTYTVADRTPPEIQNVDFRAEYDSNTGTLIITISAKIKEPHDASGVQSAEIIYRVGGEEEREVMMYNGTAYTITITIGEGASEFTYRISATDRAGNVASTQEFTKDLTEFIPAGPGGYTGGGIETPQLAIIIAVAISAVVATTYYIRKSSK